jgi:uncharacterized protein (TIGR02246 family)
MVTTDADDVRALYATLLDAWNAKDAGAFAASFSDDGEVIGFDGSIMAGPAAIEAELRRIFDDHPTGRYVGIVREVAPVTEDVVVLRAVAGVIPAGSEELKPELNSVQRLVAGRRDGRWRIALYQNTPAQFHGRPELVERLSEELRGAAPGRG